VHRARGFKASAAVSKCVVASGETEGLEISEQAGRIKKVGHPGYYMSESQATMEVISTTFFSVVDPLHISNAERLFRTAPQAFMNLWFAWVNVIANRCR
jgi:hypothetical protein